MPADPDKLAYWLLKDINRAVRDFSMIADGDRVAVAVSGGKDSLSLLRLLDLRRRTVPERYDLVALHVPGDVNGPQEQFHSPLKIWLEENGYDYQCVPFALPETENLPLNCQRCTYNRRRALFRAAAGAGCNVLAFGHHADDLAQTTLMNLLLHGKVETMAPVREYFDRKIRLIRPLCYLPEKAVRRFARACQFPEPPPLCPRSARSQRRVARDLLAQAEKMSASARVNLLRAGLAGIGLPHHAD